MPSANPAEPAASGPPLFDRAAEYDAMLQRGLQLSGEGKRYFQLGRLQALTATLPARFRPARVLDFGCGLGDTAELLAETFPGATVVGTDTALAALDHARRHHAAGGAIRFLPTSELAGQEPFDLVYLNGVLHHVPLDQRPEVAELLHRSLAPGGCCALFENHPFNPGTRLVMRRIPFDRDARTLHAAQARRLLRGAGFGAAMATRYLFVFPRFLRLLRPLEPYLARLPLGAQYLVLAQR